MRCLILLIDVCISSVTLTFYQYKSKKEDYQDFFYLPDKGLRLVGNSKEKYGFVIKNETFASFMAGFYEFIWKESKKV